MDNIGLILLCLNFQCLYGQTVTQVTGKNASEGPKPALRATDTKFLKYLQQSLKTNNYSYIDVNNASVKQNHYIILNKTTVAGSVANTETLNYVILPKSIDNLNKILNQTTKDMSSTSKSDNFRRALKDFSSYENKGINIPKTWPETEKEERTTQLMSTTDASEEPDLFGRAVKYKHPQLSQSKLKDKAHVEKKEKFKIYMMEKSKHFKTTPFRAKSDEGDANEETEEKNIEKAKNTISLSESANTPQPIMVKKEVVRSRYQERNTEKPFAPRARFDDFSDSKDTPRINDAKRYMKQQFRSETSKIPLPPPPPHPHVIDMAPAKGSRISNKRAKNRLCDRSVLIPEGAKYDSRGVVYLQPFQKVNGRSYPNTDRPQLVLPRCCNCCKKSVLGCE